ncbi:CopG family transcriptional regulator [Kitasatospora sp. NPDC056531]|uniref:ribbon-helix-helix domain-containing protein n=1 Tax=Kitasatospora sp. NPDC056531 TaxID=3345856 RepID=UPI0036990B01
MKRINVYNRDTYSDDQGKLVGWFDRDSCTEAIDEDRQWDGNNHRGVMSGLQVGYEELLRTSRGRWVRHYDSRSEFNGPEYYEYLTDEQAKEWLVRNNTDKSTDVLERYFGALEEEAGPAVGRPAVGPQIAVAYPEELLERIDAAAKAAGVSRAQWLREAASARLEATG